MAHVIEEILARRSVRDGFSPEPISESVIEEILRCGLNAPSSKNAQPWRMHVVTNAALRADLADAVQHAKDAERFVPIDPATGDPRPQWHGTVAESAAVLRETVLAVFVENRGAFSDGRRTVAGASPDHRENALIGYSFEVIGLGAAIQSIWLAAEAHRLRGVFMGDVLIAEDKIRVRLDMAGDLVGVLALGYTVGSSPAPKVLADERVVWHR